MCLSIQITAVVSFTDLDPSATKPNILHGTSTDLTNCSKHNELKNTGNFTVPANFLRSGLLNVNKTSTQDFHNMHFHKNPYRKTQSLNKKLGVMLQ